MRRAFAGIGAALLLAVSAPALADATKDECVDANGLAQSLRRAGKFTAARDQLRICAESECPRIVREDCTRRLDDLDAVQPTLVFDVKDRSGKDLMTVKVSIDGQPFANSLNGAALTVDPGTHAFTFEVDGQAPVTVRFVVHESEKSRREVVVVGPEPAAPPPRPATPVAPAPPPAVAPSSSPWPAVGWVVGGLGVVGLGVGSVFGLLAISSNNSAGCDAGGVCQNPGARYDAIHHAGVSTAAFIAGGALTAAGIVIEIAAPRGSRTPTALQAAPWIASGAAGAAVGGRF